MKTFLILCLGVIIEMATIFLFKQYEHYFIPGSIQDKAVYSFAVLFYAIGFIVIIYAVVKGAKQINAWAEKTFEK